MTQTTGFTYTFDAITKPKKPAEAELFAVELLSEQMLPDGNILARNRRNGRQLVLPVDIFDAIGYCRSFRTLGAHTAQLVKHNPASAGREADVQAVLKAVQSGGLTISAKSVCERLAPPPSAPARNMRPVVAALTWERPETLRRLLASIHDNVDFSALDGMFIVDDSTTAEHMESNRNATQDLARESGLPLRYFGASEAKEFVDELVQAVPQHEAAIRFLADRERWTEHFAAGVSRNISQLLSVGKPLVMLDDDVLCEVRENPAPRDGVGFSSQQRESVFFRDRSQWPATAPAPGNDPIRAHMQCLGLTVPEALAALGQSRLQQSSLAQASPVFAGSLTPKTRVLITQCGSLGDPGTSNNQWLATLGPESRDRLLQTEGLFDQALSARNCWMGRGRPVFSPAPNMSPITGLDNSAPLPPYFPAGRAEDRLFGFAVNHIFQDGVALDYPWAVPHLPLPERFWSEADNDFSSRPEFPGRLSEYIVGQAITCLSADPEDRRKHLAAAYGALAASSRAVLMDQFAEMWNADALTRLRLLQTSLEQSDGTPPRWREYLQSAIEQAQPPIITDFLSLGPDAGEARDGGKETERFWRDAWRNFSQGIMAWPEIRAAAAEVCEARFKRATP
jgi:hypothetical protein